MAAGQIWKCEKTLSILFNKSDFSHSNFDGLKFLSLLLELGKSYIPLRKDQEVLIETKSKIGHACILITCKSISKDASFVVGYFLPALY